MDACNSFKDSDILVLSSKWHLRPNRGEGLVYQYSKESSSHVGVTAFETVAITLCDGYTCLGDVRNLLSDTLNLGLEEAEKVVQGLLKRNNNHGPFLLPLSESGGRFTRVNASRILQEMTAYMPEPCKARRLQVPLSLLLIPSYQCETDCIYCYAYRPIQSRSAHMNSSRWVEILNEAGELGVDLITFSGGDPLTYPDIEDLLRVAVRYRMNYVLPTKTLVTRSNAERLAMFLLDFGQIQVSVDSFDSDVAAYMTRTPCYAERARSSIVNLRAAGICVQTNTVVTPINLAHIESLIRELRHLGVTYAHVTNYYRTHYCHNEALFLSPEEIDYLNNTIASLKKELDWPGLICSASVRDFSIAGSNTEPAWRERASCSAGTSSCGIVPNGDVVLCEQVPHDHRFVIGNVSRQSLLEVWNSQELMNFIVPERNLFDGTPCSTCEEFDSCHRVHGRCFRDAYFHYGRIFAPSPNCPRSSVGLRHG